MQYPVILLLALSIGQLTAANLAIRNVTVIDGSGSTPAARQTVIIRGDRIHRIGPAAQVTIPRGFTVIEGRARYVIPGLWDMHVHLWDERNRLPLYLARGITGVRDMGSDFDRTKGWRTATESGKMAGPYVVTSGPAVDGRSARHKRLPVLVAITPEDGRGVFDRLDRMEADFVSVLSDLPRDAYIALAERARKWRLPFAGEVPSSVNVFEAVEARQASIERLAGLRGTETFDETKAREVFRRSAVMGTRHVPMLTSWSRAGVREDFDMAARLVQLMRDSGVEIMPGTDTGEPNTTPGVTLHQELELLVKAGLTPMQALQSATLVPARFLGWDGVTGVLKKDMIADLVLLDANPLTDIRNVSRVSGVVKKGRYLGPAWIKATLAASK